MAGSNHNIDHPSYIVKNESSDKVVLNVPDDMSFQRDEKAGKPRHRRNKSSGSGFNFGSNHNISRP